MKLKYLLFGILLLSTSCAYAETIPYWIEDYGDGYNLWVKVPYIPANGDTTIYVEKDSNYKPNGGAVFEFFDDFDGTDLDTSKWEIVGEYSMHDGKIKLNPNWVGGYKSGMIRTKKLFGKNVIIYSKIDSHTSYIRYGFGESNGGDFCRCYSYDDGGPRWWGFNIDGDVYREGYGYDVDKLEYSQLTIGDDFVELKDNNVRYRIDHELPSVNLPVYFTSWSCSDVTLDYVYVRKYADKEPTTTIQNLGDYYKITIHNPNNYPLKNFQVKISNPSFITSKFEGLKITTSAPAYSKNKNGDKVGVLVNDKHNLDKEEKYIINLIKSFGYDVDILDADDYDKFSNYKVLYMRTGKEPVSYNNERVINALRNAIDGGTTLISEYYGGYLLYYLGEGKVTHPYWCPCVYDEVYYVKPITYHPIVNNLPIWDPPTKPDKESQLIWKNLKTGEHDRLDFKFNNNYHKIQYYYLYATYGWPGQNTNLEGYTDINEPERSVHIGDLIYYKNLGSGILIWIKCGGDSIDYIKYGPIMDKIRKNTIEYVLKYSNNVNNANDNSNPHSTEQNTQTITIYIESEPSDANVFINGEYKGITPLKLSLKEGTYTIKIKKDGYKEYTKKITLKAGESREISINLIKEDNSIILITGAVFGSLIVVGGGIYALNKRSKDKKKKEVIDELEELLKK
jgi:hypothetical protein